MVGLGAAREQEKRSQSSQYIADSRVTINWNKANCSAVTGF